MRSVSDIGAAAPILHSSTHSVLAPIEAFRLRDLADDLALPTSRQ
jgi:hypothetical protein